MRCYHIKFSSNKLLFFQDNEEVVLWMNTVGPYHNRQETYGYFTLPFCQGPKPSIGNSIDLNLQ